MRPTDDAGALAATSLLQLIWLASPALPIGGFSYSEGFEAVVGYGFVATEIEASDWLTQQLHVTLARGDLAVVARAIPAWRRDDLASAGELNAWILQTRETSELRLQTAQMGESLLQWLRNQNTATPSRLAACAQMRATYPVTFALAASATQAGVRDCLLAFAFGWAENMVQATVKSVPLGQNAGQRILARLADEIPSAVAHALRLADGERQAFAPMLAILSSRHETQYSRLFRS
ncbi:MAG: urease accessory protein UreF [Burkholderiaceae bacterium]|nr:MAG: urease accessory protein UreF [Burkholderiaceae bacterium]